MRGFVKQKNTLGCVFGVLVLLAVLGCTQSTPVPEQQITKAPITLTEVGAIQALTSNTDYNDWKNDFVRAQGAPPNLALTKSVLLSKEKIKEMIDASQEGTKGVMEAIIGDVNADANTVFYIEMRDRVAQNKGIIAIIDTEKKIARKFFATIGVSAG